MKHWGKTFIGILITVLLFWWALSGVAFLDVWDNIRQGNLILLLASVFVATFGFFIRALRWKVLLTPVKADTSLHSRFAGVSIGFMANNLLPARVGEFARAYAFSRLEAVTASAAFGTLVVERVLDGVVLLLFLTLPILTPGFPGAEAFSSGLGGVLLRTGAVAVVMVMSLLLFMAIWPRKFLNVAEGIARSLPTGIQRPLVSGLGAFVDSVSVIKDFRLLVLGFAWTFFFWLWHGVSFWLGMLAFGINTGFISAVFTEAVVGFGVAIPSAPGFFGTFHASAKFALSDVYGVSEATSLAFAFGYHFGGWIPITLIGLRYAWKLGFSLGEVGTSEKLLEKGVEPLIEDSECVAK
ncbi:MAG: lysylphosphatidylglycerol synthase transmembrane domain-containing protein [Gemmatimonadota bacterium]|nr:lysylphosphatidylglycerol synthase transmembrane domain-containing protein [Gemmatimonadota bacterium]